MRLLIISSLWPHGAHSVRAANIVINEMLSAFAAHTDIKTGLLVAGEAQDIAVSSAEQEGIERLRAIGIEVLAPVVLPAPPPPRTRLARWFVPRLVDFYPRCAYASLIEKHATAWQPDVVLVPWSEWLTHACAGIPARKFAYYGNPDPKGARIRADLRYRNHEISMLGRMREKARANVLERLHLSTMKAYEWLGNVAENDAKYYEANGHPNAFYIQNMWMPAQVGVRPACDPRRPVKIVGSIGKVNGTANTLGLEYLGKEVMPALDRALGGRPYEVHIFGAGTVHPISKAALSGHPKVIWRGFVDDIDAEMRESDAFLCVNNATAYKVGHTRYLHAWSLGVPVVGHADAALSMPEMKHEKNSLLGRSSDEIAESVQRIVNDEVIRERIVSGGYQTFTDIFGAKHVVGKIVAKVTN